VQRHLAGLGNVPAAPGANHAQGHTNYVNALPDGAGERVDRERRHRADRPHFVVQFR